MELHECRKCKTKYPADGFYRKAGRVHTTWCKQCYREWHVARQGGSVQKECEHCGSSFTCSKVAAGRRRFCGRACKNKSKNAAVTERLHAAKPDRSCPHCGDSLPNTMRADAVYCSARCNDAAHQFARKSLRKLLGGARHEPVERAYIIERDKGVCHLCGGKPALGDIHLDHVVPLSCGGDHTPANVRVACASCNMSKRADSRGEQLAIVG